MDASLALGSQCAVGGSLVYQRCQIRSNLVTKSHHITANPVVKPESRFTVSGNRIHSNSVTKRRLYQTKMMAASANDPTPKGPASEDPASKDPAPKGPGVYTQVNLFNSTDQNLILKESRDWIGSGNPPLVIRANVVLAFEHNADPQVGGSVGGVAYAVADECKWIVAWTNTNNQPNKFYTNIVKLSDPIDWNIIREKLSSGQADASKITDYKTTVTIDETSPTPNVAATLQRVYK